MSTGDLRNNIRKLQKGLKLIKYDEPVDIDGLSKGVPANFLPIYHYVFTMFSASVAEKIVEMDIELFGKSDLKFMEGVYRVLRDMFSYKPPLTRDRFFASGFAEKKVIMCCEILNLVYDKSRSLGPQKGNASLISTGRSVSKVQFQKAKPSDWKVQRADCVPPVSEVIRKVANHSTHSATIVSTCRPTSAPTCRPANGRHNGNSPVELASDPMTVPKTPAIHNAKPSAVQVVCVPRATCVPPANTVEETEQPVDIVGMSSANISGSDKVTELSISSDQLIQLQKQISTMHRKMELMMEKVTKLEDQTMSLKAEQKDVIHADTRKQESENTEDNLETILARLLLLENRVSMIESRLGADVLSNGTPVQGFRQGSVKEYAPVAPSTNGFHASSSCPSHAPSPISAYVNSKCPSPIKPQDNEKNYHVAEEELNTPVAVVGGNAEEEFDKARTSTPTEKSVDISLSSAYIDQETREKAESIKARIQDTQGMLKTLSQNGLDGMDNVS